MTRYRILSLIAIFCLSLLVATPVLAAKGYRANSFDVWVDIQKDGSLIVTETVKFRFDGGPFTYVFREISRNGTDDIAIIDASMDGVVFPSGTGAGQIEIDDGDPVKVTWHFTPMSNSVHEFVLRYRVLGAIRTGQADTLIWRAIPQSHDYAIDQPSLTVTYPVDKHPLKTPTLDRTYKSTGLDNGFRLTTGKLDSDESVILTIQFASGNLVTQPPAWQSLQEQKDRQIGAALPYGLIAAALTGLLGLIWVMVVGRSFRRDINSYPDATQHSSTPPGPLPAALAARLTGSSVAFLGTLFDLAQRGVLRIEEGPKKWGSRTFGLIRQPGNEPLKLHEQVFIDALFHKAKNNSIALSEISSLAYNSKFTQALDQELTAAGWRDAERSARRNRALALAGLGLIMGMMVFLGGLITGGLLLLRNPLAAIFAAILMGAGAASSGVGLVGLIAAAVISTLSEEGLRQTSAWKGFTEYLRNITRGRETIISPDVFERYLPYAAGFGIATEWVKFFQKMADVPVPEWFQGLQSSVEDGSFAAIMAAITAADSSASAASGAAGAAASGGGSSGAG
jgi:hypothetical protein